VSSVTLSLQISTDLEKNQKKKAYNNHPTKRNNNHDPNKDTETKNTK
jgi:hypothetical protein